VTFPLTRRMVLISNLKLAGDCVLKCAPKSVASINHRIALHSYRFLYSPADRFTYMGNDKQMHTSRDLEPMIAYRNSRISAGSERRSAFIKRQCDEVVCSYSGEK